jgi:hypothetical protein
MHPGIWIQANSLLKGSHTPGGDLAFCTVEALNSDCTLPDYLAFSRYFLVQPCIL